MTLGNGNKKAKLAFYGRTLQQLSDMVAMDYLATTKQILIRDVKEKFETNEVKIIPKISDSGIKTSEYLIFCYEK